MNNDFFIGWQSKENLKISGLVKGFALLLFVFVFLMSFVITRSERGFSDAQFDFGTISEFKGIYFDTPYPILQYSENGLLKSAILVAFGKKGAQSIIKNYEKKNNAILNGRLVKLKGTKIYRDNAVAIELTDGEKAIQSHNSIGPPQLTRRSTIKSGSFMGEIVDIKCYLGVMKPAESKPHRSCAVRCISGGIPPVLRIKEGDNEEYYLITGNNNELVTDYILDYVADKVRLCGEQGEQNGWKTISVDTDVPIQRLWPHWANKDMALCKP